MRWTLLALGTLLVPLLLWVVLPIPSSGAPPRQRLSEVQGRLHRAQGQAQVKRRREQVLTTDIAASSRRIASLDSRLAALQRRESLVQLRLDAARRQLARLQADLRSERLRLLRLRRRLQHARTVLSRRLVAIYKTDRPDIVTVVLEADGFEQLIEDVDFVRRVSDQDRRIIERVRVSRDQARRQAARLGVLERRQLGVTGVIEARRNDVATLRRSVAATRSRADAERGARRAALARVRVSRVRLDREVAGLQAQQGRIRRVLVRAQRAAAARASSATAASAPPTPAPPSPAPSNGGALIWPVNGPITSPYCERRAWEACHPGLDIGVPEGTPIRAATAGTVVLLQPTAASGGYGNYTCIQHTGNLSTCYAHQSRFGTTAGARVGQGQVIGYVGNTGNSFGAHLHFEVRLNGSVVNPLNYVG